MNDFIFDYFFGFSTYTFVSNVAFFVSYPLTYAAFILLLLWVLFVSSNKMQHFLVLFLSGLSAWFLSQGIKLFFQTSRPFLNLDFTPLYAEPGFSFPSTHVAVFSALGFSMFVIDRKLGSVLLALTVFVAISRIILGVHYTIDIIGGVVVGFIISYTLKKVIKSI